MSTVTTLLWHDYETSGANSRWDRPVQFACLRTDSELNVVDEPLVCYCRPASELLPHPESVLITGITPQLALERGVSEHLFAKQIYRVLAQQGTCRVGYNSIGFDEHVTRHLLYRNFYPPYETEWVNGNSRWDIIDTVRACGAFRPDGIEWCHDEAGYPGYRLEKLTAVNDIDHGNAHDALSDVNATLGLARLIKEKQPQLFDYGLSLRDAQVVHRHLKVGSRQPVLHVSAHYGKEHYCVGAILALVEHPARSNRVLCFDLTTDPGYLLDIDVAQLKKHIRDMDSIRRCGITPLATNRSPFVVSTSILDDEIVERVNFPKERCDAHLARLSEQWEPLCEKLREAYRDDGYGSRDETRDADDLYAYGYIDREDVESCRRVRESSPQELGTGDWRFRGTQLPELLFRYRARNFPDTLSAQEQLRWDEFCAQRLHEPPGGLLGLESYMACLSELRKDNVRLSAKTLRLLDELETWPEQIAPVTVPT